MSTGRRLGSLGLIGVLLAAMLVATVWLQGRQLEWAGQAQAVNDGYSVLSLYQVETEYLRLLEQWRDTLSAEVPDLGTLQLRYDVWVSRISLLTAPPLRDLMNGDRAYTEAVEQLQAFVQHADKQLGAERTGPPSPDALAPLTDDLRALSAPVHAMTVAAAHRVAARVDARNQALSRQTRIGIALNVFLCALSVAFALLAMRQMRQAQQRGSALEQLATRLREAQRRAEAASEAKSAFLAQVSHEIRTPFQGLLGMLTLLRSGGLPPRQAEQLRVAVESAEHLLAILDDTLDLSQMEAGRMTLRPAPTDLPALLRQVEAVLRPLASAKSLLLQVDVEPAVPRWIVADAKRLKQVLFNLLSNAIKFCIKGSVTLDVLTVAGPPERLRFVVTDTGMGMDRDATQRLFGAPKPGEVPVPHAEAGAGLGLEISRNLARLMGGDIQVLSVPGEGSRFTFEVPLQRSPPAPDANRPTLPVAPPTHALQVLVAEDHPVNRQYMAALLEQMHHPAYFVANGRDAVQAVQMRPFDLVLMDLHMPELDGIGAALAIRALPDRAAATVPIIALTADAFKETRERCLIAGMNDFLTKPVNAQDLAAALRRLYGQEAADAPQPGPTPSAAPVLAGDTAPLIDTAALDQVRQDLGADRTTALLEDFLRYGPQAVQTMRSAVRDGQPLALRAEAHAARGAALNLGLAALAQTAQALHEGAAHLPAHEVAHLVQRFESLLERTRQAAAEAGLLQAQPT